MFGLVLLVVLSASMGGALPVGSLALAIPQPEYFVGDIVTFKVPNSGELLTHRVVEVEDVGGQQVFKTQGDANNVADDWGLVDDDIVGKVVFHLPYLGYLLRLPQLLLAAVVGIFNP